MSAPNAPCPCGSGRKYKKCCRVFHYGKAPAHPEQLMRARYVAYALGEVGFILETTHPDSPHFQADAAAWKVEVGRFCRQTTFEALIVEEAREDGDAGMVRFFAKLSAAGRDASFGEESTFARVGGRWLYVAGKRVERGA